MAPPCGPFLRSLLQALGHWQTDSAEDSGKERDYLGLGGTLRLLIPVEDYVCFYDRAATERRLTCGDKEKKNPKESRRHSL